MIAGRLDAVAHREPPGGQSSLFSGPRSSSSRPKARWPLQPGARHDEILTALLGSDEYLPRG
jgi:hypothetical protein